MSTSYDVFVYHNVLDELVVERLCTALVAAGIKPWVEAGPLEPADGSVADVEPVLDTAPAVLVCVGEHGIELRDDVGRAVFERAAGRTGGLVMAVFLPGKPDSAAMPGFLGFRMPLDLREEAEWPQRIEGLAKAVEMGRRALARRNVDAEPEPPQGAEQREAEEPGTEPD